VESVDFMADLLFERQSLIIVALDGCLPVYVDLKPCRRSRPSKTPELR
jgi:hypothetical protein